MKKIALILTIIMSIGSLLTGCSGYKEKANDAVIKLADNEEYYEDTFGQGEIIDIKVDIEEEEWNDILTNPTTEEYHKADITVNGTKVESVGFRTKGFSSLTTVAQSESDRYGFKIKTDKYEDGQTLNGLNEFVLNGSFADPSYMREYLTYLAMAKLDGITPFITYANLYINDELFGFYLFIESYDDSFIERYSNTDDTCLYKAQSDFCTLLPSDDGSGFDLQYGEDKNLDNVKNLISVLNNTTAENKEELEKVLDVDSVLKAIAVNTVMGNYDSYSGSKAHNYYLLYSSGKFSYIGWDYNMSMGGFMEDGGASVTVDVNSPVYGVDISQRPLIEKLLAIDEYKSRYLDYLNTLCNYFEDFETQVNELSSFIKDNVENDPSAFYTLEEFESNVVKSDADLTEVEGKQGFQGGMPNKGDMEKPTMDIPEGIEKPNGENMPQPPTGEQPPEINEDEVPVGGENQQGQQNGMIPPQNGEGFQKPNGEALPNMGENGMSKPNGGMGMMSGDVVSIVDYLTQRIEQIKTQLDI